MLYAKCRQETLSQNLLGLIKLLTIISACPIVIQQFTLS